MKAKKKELSSPRRDGDFRQLLILVLLVAGMLAGGLYLLVVNLPQRGTTGPAYQDYAGIEQVLKADLLPGAKVRFPATVIQAAFTKPQDGGKAYNIYQWTLNGQALEARFSSKLKELPDGRITISGVVQSRQAALLTIFVDATSFT